VEDPTRRPSPGSWPRDRPVRWGFLARSLGWFIWSTAWLLVQVGLVVLVVANGEAPWGPLLALVWGGATLATAWAWVTGRGWIALPPIVTALATWLVSTRGG
jgi:fatty acid desaturase